MNKQLTAMQELIKYLEQNMQSAENKYSKGALRISIRQATELLSKEKEQIQQAFVAGDERGVGNIPFNAEQFLLKHINKITMNKQPQTCYVESNKHSTGVYHSTQESTPCRKLKNVYIFTKEELEAHDSFTINVTDRYYAVLCQTCGWVGSSSELEGGGAIADTSDHFDCYCPVCRQIDPDECEPVQQISIKDAALKIGTLLKHYIQLNEENHWYKMSKTIEVEGYANQKKNEWQREAADWFYPEEGEYPEMVENQNYSLNVLAEVEGMNDIQVMCYCYIPGEDGGFVWANCDKKLDEDAEFDDNYTVKKWKPIPQL